MSRSAEIIAKIQDLIDRFEIESLKKKPDEFVAVDELAKSLNRVRTVFEQNEEMD